MKAVNTFLQHFKHFSSLFFTKISRDFTIFFIKWISTHTSLVGCDPCFSFIAPCKSSFLLTHPLWDVTTALWTYRTESKISTHTSLVGCDTGKRIPRMDTIEISTHTSLVGCDYGTVFCRWCVWKFLLTHPLWDVTLRRWGHNVESGFLLTHPLWDVTTS